MPEGDSLPAGFLWCALPVYNNRETLRRVVLESLAVIDNVVVVDDGSSDADVAELLAGLDVTILTHERNRGKGAAILTASRYIESRGGTPDKPIQRWQEFERLVSSPRLPSGLK